MSMRLRLTLWYVALLCLGLVLFAGAVIWQTDRRADDTIDRMLIQRAQDVAADLRFGSAITLRADSPDESSRQLGEAALWIRVLDARGRVAVRQGPPVPGLSSALLSGAQIGLRDQEVAGGLRVRVYTLPVAPRGRREATVQVITTTRQALDARDRLVAAMGGAGVLVVLAAALGGLFLADRSLRPVDRLTRLAGEIGEGDLHRRVGDEMWSGATRRPGRNDELSRLAATFDAMLGRLRDAGERRRRLTADAAHELCTPVATIASSAEIALRHPREPDEYRATLEHILEESRHMGRVVEDLLLLAQADAGQLPLHRDLVELDEVCLQAVRAFQPLAAERAVTLTAVITPGVVLVMGDDIRLGQVVRNLLDNALRYTPPGGAIRLEMDEAPPVGARDVVAIRVRDTGPGITPDERARVFDRFHRAAGAPREESRRAGGSGLGLAISRAIVEAHGGSIAIEDGDEEMPGARLVVALPGVDA